MIKTKRNAGLFDCARDLLFRFSSVYNESHLDLLPSYMYQAEKVEAKRGTNCDNYGGRTTQLLLLTYFSTPWQQCCALHIVEKKKVLIVGCGKCHYDK